MIDVEKESIGMTSKSPLRYPGGKTRAIPDLLLFFMTGVLDVLVSPFIGGASGELELLVRGLVNRVVAYDAHYPLVAFWNRLLRSPGLVANKASLVLPKFGRDSFYCLRDRFAELDDSIEQAAAYFALNRSSVNGLTFSGGYSTGHPRFTPSSIERLASFIQPRLSVAQADFRVSIPKHKNDMLLLDPPYIRASRTLYGYKGHLHKTFKHQSLADLLHQRDRWILLYDDSPEVRELYKGHLMVRREWSAGMNKSKNFGHLIIISRDVVIPTGAEDWDWIW
jgi:DNA adenine methylase